MMRIVMVTALLFCVHATQAADDPAIALCEILIQSELVAPKSYERVSAHVDGLTASVTYDAVNKYNAPLRGHDECSFSQDANGNFMLASDVDVSREMARLEELRSTPIANEDDRKARISEADSISKRAETKLKRAILREALAIASGEYPIPAGKTALR